MSVARVTTITAGSTTSFDDALRGGLEREQDVARHHRVHVVEQKAKVDRGHIAQYRVTMAVTFILED